jgi:competence protein ComEA
MRVAVVLFLLSLTVRLMAGVPQVAPAPQATIDLAKEKETFALVCEVCHGSDLLEGSLRTPAEVDDLIATMQSYGASATPEQFALVRTFLLRSYGKANVNSATAPDLAAVLDLTPEVAAAVVAQRERSGMFSSADDLAKIPGLDAAKLDQRKDRLLF